MSHKQLDVWQMSMELVLEIYKLTQNFPKEELYGLTSQIRRSAVSIPSNIAEGCARQTAKETVQFLHICLGSIAELETQLIIADKLNYFNLSKELSDNLINIRKMAIGLIKHHKDKV